MVSLRNISAFAILDGDTYRLKRLVRGGFFMQHSVMHLEGTRFLMFDNLGREGRHGPSRLLMVDIADGTETTIFPNDRTPAHLRNLYAHSVLSSGDIHSHVQDGDFYLLGKFAQEWPRLQAVGLLLPDLVEFYWWLHTALGEPVLLLCQL